MTDDETRNAEQEARIYAADLLNRADVQFEARDVAMLAAVIPLIEGDLASWLLRQGQAANFPQLRPASFVRICVHEISQGDARPSLPAPNPVSASREGNPK